MELIKMAEREYHAHEALGSSDIKQLLQNPHGFRKEKPSLTSAKSMIKRVIEKVAKDEKINQMRTIQDKLRSVKSAYKLNNKGE